MNTDRCPNCGASCPRGRTCVDCGWPDNGPAPTQCTPLTYDWLLNVGGFHKLERLERQPTDHVRRCIGTESIGRTFLAAPEDTCIDIAPENWPNPRFWFCWLTRASAQNRHPSTWVSVRSLQFVEEVVLLYEGLTGRKFGPQSWRRDEMQPALFNERID